MGEDVDHYGNSFLEIQVLSPVVKKLLCKKQAANKDSF